MLALDPLSGLPEPGDHDRCLASPDPSVSAGARCPDKTRVGMPVASVCSVSVGWAGVTGALGLAHRVG